MYLRQTRDGLHKPIRTFARNIGNGYQFMSVVHTITGVMRIQYTNGTTTGYRDDGLPIVAVYGFANRCRSFIVFMAV